MNTRGRGAARRGLRPRPQWRGPGGAPGAPARQVEEDQVAGVEERARDQPGTGSAGPAAPSWRRQLKAPASFMNEPNMIDPAIGYAACREPRPPLCERCAPQGAPILRSSPRCCAPTGCCPSPCALPCECRRSSRHSSVPDFSCPRPARAAALPGALLLVLYALAMASEPAAPARRRPVLRLRCVRRAPPDRALDGRAPISSSKRGAGRHPATLGAPAASTRWIC